MIYIIIGLIILGLIAYMLNQKKQVTDSMNQSIISEDIQTKVKSNLIQNDDATYSEKLTKTKELYPFESWRENFFEYEMEQYTEENCNAAKKIFDTLIINLIEIGEDGNKITKVDYFEKAIKSLNELNNNDESLIETGEREDLCELIDQITIACGLNPVDYADGEGIADLYREW